jgi:hypothetical protein
MKLADSLYYERAKHFDNFPEWLRLYRERQCVCARLQVASKSNPDAFADCENALYGYRFHNEQELDPMYSGPADDAVTLKNGHVLLPGIGDAESWPS